jgi:hypothetical protein
MPSAKSSSGLAEASAKRVIGKGFFVKLRIWLKLAWSIGANSREFAARCGKMPWCRAAKSQHFAAETLSLGAQID